MTKKKDYLNLNISQNSKLPYCLEHNYKIHDKFICDTSYLIQSGISSFLSTKGWERVKLLLYMLSLV